jgi:hypothetical protein
MFPFTVGDAATVCRLLHQIGGGEGLPSRIRDAATYWADEVGPGMSRADVQTVAFLLKDAGMQRRLPSNNRHQAQYWAAYLTNVG